MKKKFQIFFKNLIPVIYLTLFLSLNVNSQTIIQTFTYTGAPQTFTVPSCVSSLSFEVRGAQGGAAIDKIPTNGPGGLGGMAIGILNVIPGQVYTLYVGGQGNTNGSGGYNGGGTAGTSTAGTSCFGGPAGGGGGASDIRFGGITLANRIIVGGGGGGAGRDYCNGSCQPCGCGGNGGCGGWLTGQPGFFALCVENPSYYPGNMINGGAPGTQTIGGAGGPGDNATVSTGIFAGTSGSLGIGGNGGNGTYDVAGGGGGGGYYGGGGGGGAGSGSGVGGGGGGGGSSYITGLLSASTASCIQLGNGEIKISYSTNITPIGITVLPNSICIGGTATLSASGLVTYTWSTSSNSSSIVVSPTVNTTYSVSATNTAGCMSAQIITLLVDGSPPILTVASSQATVCQNYPVTLTASGAVTYSWTGGITNGLVFYPSSTSGYTVTGVNGCGTATASIFVYTNPAPTLTITTSSPTVCSGSQVTLTAMGATTYTWTNGITNGSAYTPTATNVYTVTGTGTLNCLGLAMTTITVFNSPNQIPLVTPSLICIGSSATLTSGGATNYTWLPGNNNTPSISVTPTSTTTYTLTKSNANCVDVKTITVLVNTLPLIAAIATPTRICVLQTSTLAVAGAVTYSWSPVNLNASSIFVSPSVTTVYTVTASDGLCLNTTTVMLAVDPNPTINIVANPSVICPGDVSNLTVGGAINYTWTPSSLAGTAVAVTPTTASLYSVAGENSFGCISNASQVILVNPAPTVNVSSNKQLVCVGGSVTLTASGATTYSWDNGTQGSVNNVNPQIPTTYTVIGYDQNATCSTTKTISVAVFNPTFSVPGSTAVCIGGSAVLSASGANSYTWNGNYYFQSITVSPTIATVYPVSATSSSLGVNCISTATVLVTISPNPTVTATSNKLSICKGEKVILTGNGASTYTWNTSASGTTIQTSPAAQTVYTVTGTDANGCQSTGTVLVKVSSCNGIEEVTLEDFGIKIYPNPNTGEFTISSISDIDLTLINELGQFIKLLKLNDINSHKIAVSNIANGIYFIVGEKEQKKLQAKIVVTK